MKLRIFLILSIVSMLALSACANNGQEYNEPEVHVDWEAVPFEEMMSGATDLVAIGHVTSVEEKEGVDSLLTAQFAQVDILDVYYGEPKGESLVLYQSVDKVKPNASYLFFLKYIPEKNMYVLSDMISKSLISEGNKATLSEEEKIEVRISGIRGNYTQEELHELFDKYENSNE